MLAVDMKILRAVSEWWGVLHFELRQGPGYSGIFLPLGLFGGVWD